jgi:hypothetical protein
MTTRPPARGEPPRRVGPGYRPWAARRQSPRQPGGIGRARQQAAQNQRAQVSAFWAMILGRFRDYLHITATLNDDLHSTQGGPHETGQ